ncbi:MAG: ABC transporter permease [Bacillus sp. (in: Bacteria)]|nr:ABC transporter permease [Bacillus sp. (in: firmicutes)]
MEQWFVLFKKEFVESIRNFKWLWIPIVFVLLGITQPVTSYYLPDIIKNFGGLPEGAVMEFPLPTGAQVLAETLGQFNQIGILVLVLAFMGTVAGERTSGTNIMILVKPVSYISYITAKWVHISLLAVSSFVLGFLLALYYTHLLIETVPFSQVIQGIFIYILWLLFVITLVVFFSTIIKSSGVVAFLTLGITITLSIVGSIVPNIMRWSPTMLTSHSYSFFQTGSGGEALFLSIICTVLLIIVMLATAIYVFRNKEMAVHTT